MDGTLSAQAKIASPTQTYRPRVGTILQVDGTSVYVELDAEPGKAGRKGPYPVAYPHTPAIAAGQRCAVVELDDGTSLVSSRWPA